MTDKKIARINELSKKSREPSGLTDGEKSEQQLLRREYIDAMKQNLKTQLESLVPTNEEKIDKC
ncbi:MAG: DUF896 domain-containing protein [Oscillospiraceae bacterium]